MKILGQTGRWRQPGLALQAQTFVQGLHPDRSCVQIPAFEVPVVSRYCRSL